MMTLNSTPFKRALNSRIQKIQYRVISIIATQIFIGMLIGGLAPSLAVSGALNVLFQQKFWISCALSQIKVLDFVPAFLKDKDIGAEITAVFSVPALYIAYAAGSKTLKSFAKCVPAFIVADQVAKPYKKNADIAYLKDVFFSVVFDVAYLTPNSFGSAGHLASFSRSVVSGSGKNDSGNDKNTLFELALRSANYLVRGFLITATYLCFGCAAGFGSFTIPAILYLAGASTLARFGGEVIADNLNGWVYNPAKTKECWNIHAHTIASAVESNLTPFKKVCR